jgi:hypothetical protein
MGQSVGVGLKLYRGSFIRMLKPTSGQGVGVATRSPLPDWQGQER